MRGSALVPSALAVLLAGPAVAAMPAFDDASDPVYDNGWSGGDDGGSGWLSGWLGLNAPATYAVTTSTANGDGDSDMDGDIDTGGRAWAITVNTLSVPANVSRQFEPVLSVGQTVTVEIDHDPVPDPGAGGIRLISSIGEQRFALIWLGSNQDYFALGADFQAMNVPYTDEGLTIAFHFTGTDSFSVDLTPIGGPTTTVSGMLTAGLDLKTLILNASSSGATESWFFNSIAVPEPGSGASAGVVLVTLLLLRRRQSTCGSIPVLGPSLEFRGSRTCGVDPPAGCP